MFFEAKNLGLNSRHPPQINAPQAAALKQKINCQLDKITCQQ
jgi:hypothetical protein